MTELDVLQFLALGNRDTLNRLLKAYAQDRSRFRWSVETILETLEGTKGNC